MELLIGFFLGLSVFVWVLRGKFVLDGPPPKGTFTIFGYKNNELIYKEEVTDDYYIVTAGDRFDKIEIL